MQGLPTEPLGFGRPFAVRAMDFARVLVRSLPVPGLTLFKCEALLPAAEGRRPRSSVWRHLLMLRLRLREATARAGLRHSLLSGPSRQARRLQPETSTLITRLTPTFCTGTDPPQGNFSLHDWVAALQPPLQSSLVYTWFWGNEPSALEAAAVSLRTAAPRSSILGIFDDAHTERARRLASLGSLAASRRVRAPSCASCVPLASFDSL